MSPPNEQTVPQTGTTINNELVDSHRAARRLGLAEQTLRKMRIRGDGPQFLKLNRSVRYRVRDIDAWLDARVTTQTGAGA